MKIVNLKFFMNTMKPFAISTAFIGSFFIGATVVSEPTTGSDMLNIQEPSRSVIKDVSPSKDVFIKTLTLVDESLSQVLKLLERWTNCILIIGNNLPKATFSLSIPMPLSREEAISVLKSMLAANGIGITTLNEKTLRIMPLIRAKNSAPKFTNREELRQLTGSQEMGSCLFRVNNLVAREASRVVSPLLTPLISSIITLDKANSLLITDSISNLKQVDAFLEKIDKVGDIQESILFFIPKNTSAESLKHSFEGLQTGALKCYLLGNTSFAADKATNLFTVVTPKGNEPLIQEFVARLDAPTDPLIQHHVFRIQHGSCKEMTELIKKLMQQQKQIAINDNNNAGTNKGNASNTTNTFSRQLTIECDERLNAIVAYGTPSDISQIQNLISQLDIVLPQVRIEVIIAEVKLQKGQVSGLESFTYNVDPSRGSTPNTSMHTFSKITSAQMSGSDAAFSISSLGLNHFRLDSVFNTAKKDANVAILSSPTLLTTHAREASLRITETRPYLSSIQSKITDANDAGISNSTIEKVDAGIELTVKPLIGTNGVIQLEIDQKVDNFTTESTNVAGSKLALPNINRRQAKSFISVNSGETIVLAGLKQKEVINQKKRMFLLGDLPLFGDALFSGKTKTEDIKELIIFIRPYLLSDTEAAQKDCQTYKGHLDQMTQKEVNSYLEKGQLTKEKTPRKHRGQKQKHVLHGKRLRLREKTK